MNFLKAATKWSLKMSPKEGQAYIVNIAVHKKQSRCTNKSDRRAKGLFENMMNVNHILTQK